MKVDDFIDYVKRKLKISISDYVKDFKEFFNMHVDINRNGYASSYELKSLSEKKIEVKVSLLDFIKESLNGMIEVDNKLN